MILPIKMNHKKKKKKKIFLDLIFLDLQKGAVLFDFNLTFKGKQLGKNKLVLVHCDLTSLLTS